MRLDIRLPMGLMFTLMGAIMTVFGLTSLDSPIYKKSLNMDVNLWWGIVVLVFGLIMLGLAWRASKRPHRMDGPADHPTTPRVPDVDNSAGSSSESE